MFDNKIQEIFKIILKESEGEIYLVGGSIRDILLGQTVSDFDFAVPTEAIKFAEKIGELINGTFIVLDIENDIARVVVEKTYIFDFAAFKGEDILGDLKKRDFTINSMCINLKYIFANDISKHVIDNVGGIEDLRNRVLRLTYDKAFIDDPVRIVRGFRLASKGFMIPSELLNKIELQRTLIKDCAKERLWSELVNIFCSKNIFSILDLMEQSKILEIIIPEIKGMKEVGKCKYHTVDVWTHTKNVLNTLDEFLSFILSDNSWEESIKEKYIYKNDLKEQLIINFNNELISKLAEVINQNITKTHPKKAIIRIAAILHDIGKPEAYRVQNEMVSFRHHEQTGGSIVKNKMKKIKASRSEISYLSNMVYYHGELLGYYNNFYKKQLENKKVLFDIFLNTEGINPDLIILSFADVIGTYKASSKDDDAIKYMGYIKWIFEEYFKFLEAKKELKVRQEEVIEIIGKDNSKMLGKIFKDVVKLNYINEKLDKESQLNYIRGTFRKFQKIH